jgi:hypothetical protein
MYLQETRHDHQFAVNLYDLTKVQASSNKNGTYMYVGTWVHYTVVRRK